MFKKFLVGTAFVAALGYYFVGGALLAATQLQAAVEEKDGTKLVSLIDFESLREDLKSDMMAAMASESDDPMAMAFGGAMAGGIIDGMLQPTVIEQMVNSGNASLPGTGGHTSLSDTAEVYSKIGFMKFTITIADKGQEADIILEPRGLTWKVVGIDVEMDQLQ
jgi:hypothetical protein